MFSGPSVTVVEGAVWDNISLINTRKGEDMNWGEEDGKGGDGAEEVVKGENDGEHEECNNY